MWSAILLLLALGMTTAMLATALGEGEKLRRTERGRRATLSSAERRAATPSGLYGPREEEEEFMPLMLMQRAFSTGDLWESFDGGNADWQGTGSRQDPYRIRGIADLMGLSRAVAEGESFSGKYFELQGDIDLGDLNENEGCWNPIGWYRNRTDLSGVPKTAFSGTFDGGGHTISGLRFTRGDHDYSYLGLFGRLKDAFIHDLRIRGEEVSGASCIGLLAGKAEGSTRILEVSVEGAVYASEGDVGGLVGSLDGGTKRVIVENCSAENVTVNGEGRNSFAGGLTGSAQRADLCDVRALTMNGDSSRIRGKGYVGGIAGVQNDTNIYNAYVAGTVGGNGSRATGGITGLYESGNLIVAWFEGEIGRTNQGAAAHEGTFIGTREFRSGFRYGTGRSDHVSYLYAGREAQAKNAVGSSIPDDNTWTYDAHIGYVTDYGRKYVRVAGKNREGCGERFFYEELEDGIRHIITRKLGLEEGGLAEKTPAFQPDHFAPGNQGEPVRGYLVSIPRIDTKNANGTYDNDVAILTAISMTNNSYYRQIDKEHPSAVAPGCSMMVVTAAKNRDGDRYQMVYDRQEPGNAKPPTYLDEKGEKRPMTYVKGGSYTFKMPAANTELSAEYVKVTTRVDLSPQETEIFIRQIRSGDRKAPSIVTEVLNREGVLIARYINGKADTSLEVLPVRIHGEHNGEGSAGDRRLLWSIDDTDLLQFAEDFGGGYTTEDARIIPNMDSSFIREILKREERAQAEGGYQEAIGNTTYTDTAVLTAATRAATSTDHQEVTAACRVKVHFQILDQTTLRVEGLQLNRQKVTLELVRKLTGDRKNPKEEYIASGPVTLDASLVPPGPFYKNVSWKDREDGKLIAMKVGGRNGQSCSLSMVYDPKGRDNPAWIQNIIDEEDAEYQKQGMTSKREGKGMIQEQVRAVSEDQTHGVVSALCEVTLLFRTQDETVTRVRSGGGSSGGGGKGAGAAAALPLSGSAAGPSREGVWGTWLPQEDGRWMFREEGTYGRLYRDEWGLIQNPYAKEGQSRSDWFRFTAEGYMLTGWYQNAHGEWYCLNPISDNTLGRMLKGWNLLDGSWYYFQPEGDSCGRALTGWQWIDGNGDGTAECYYLDPERRGAMVAGCITPDGYQVDDEGRWILEGRIVTRTRE